MSKYTYSSLPDGLEREFLKYELGVDLLFDTPYNELLDIFARINSYTVKLEPQEIFNARYLGYFKQTVYKLGYKYVDYLINGGVLTKAKVTRMAEAELASDLFVALLDGVQTNKGVESFYKAYEDEQGNLEEIESRFDRVMSFIGTIYKAEELKNTNYARQQLFYSLFASIGHLLYGVKNLDPKVRKPITEKSAGKLRVALDNLSAQYDEVPGNIDDGKYPKDFKDFIYYSRRGTTDSLARVQRSNYICKRLVASL